MFLVFSSKKGDWSANGWYTILQELNVCFIETYACFGKTWAKTHLPRQHWIVSIFTKQVVKQEVGEREGNFEILAFPNQYKDILDDLIDDSDSKSPDQARLFYIKFYNTFRSEASLADLLERNYLDKDFLDRSSWLAFKTGNLQVRQYYIVTPQARYKKSRKR